MEAKSIKINTRPTVKVLTRKQLVALSGGRCSLGSCRAILSIGQNSFIGEVAMIESVTKHGTRYNGKLSPEEIISIDNLILLCPNCHRLIDKEPRKYSVSWLKKEKAKHLEDLREILSPTSPVEVKLDELTKISLKEAVNIWEDNKDNSSEEFWQKLLTKCPSVLKQVFPNSSFQLGSKCNVGGKDLSNQNGNIVDFVYASNDTSNVVLVEIKTPTKNLLGGQYRNNSYSIDDELSGGIVQVLNYREQLLKEYYQIKGDDDSYNVFNPKCLVLIGSIEAEIDNSTKLKSLELFRNCLTGVQVITYDELFNKAKDILELVE
jgi:hypothetical protein